MDARWFDALGTCPRCGKAATGILRGARNENLRPSCKRCADFLIKKSDRERKIKTETERHD
jgi:hypothetical protein